MSMNKRDLEHLVSELRKRGKEGAYWDFKQEWHDNIEDLIKDIICFANTVHNKDCYLIFGVNDSCEIVGMQKPRRKQSDILDTISKLTFASSHAPSIAVDSVTLESQKIDVLTVFNTDQTPLYLNRQYGKMKAGCIYTRTEDRNTPDNGNASFSEIEFLWKKRFGMTKPALSFILDHLANKHEWNELEQTYYNIYRPEFVLSVHEDDSDRFSRDADEFYGYVQTNSRMSFELVDLKANNTVLMTKPLAVLDSGRLIVPVPDWGFIHRGAVTRDPIAYKYYIEGSDTEKILHFLYDPENEEQYYALMRHMEVVLLFHSQQEKESFEDFCLSRLDSIEKYVSDNMESVYVDDSTKIKVKTYKKRILIGNYLNQLLQEFRKVIIITNNPETAQSKAQVH